MPNLYARATALPNVVGRIDYISSPRRQERLLAAYDGAADLLEGQFWRQLAKESRTAFEQFSEKSRNGKELKCCEGREIMIQLSNSLLERMTPEEIVKTVADEFREKLGLTVAVGLHLKHYGAGPDNLHVHVVFPERELLQEPVIKIADRALFFDAQGKRRYKKSEIMDENKQLLPGCRIVKKGEIYEQRYFGSVDPKYSYKSWMKGVKTNVILPLRNGKLRGDVEITEFDPKTGKLPQQHIGHETPKEMATKILRANEMVIVFNRLVDTGVISKTAALAYQAKVMGAADRNAVLRQVLREVKQKEIQQSRSQGERTVRAKRNWEIQRQIDLVRVARETGAGNAADLEEKKLQLGRELGQAKREYERLQEEGADLQDLMQAAQAIQIATDRYAEVARAVETLQRSRDKPTRDDLDHE